MSQCKIYLENYSGTYYAGGEIRGRIECYFDEETTLRGIKIRLKCKERNEWTGTEEYNDPTDNQRKTRYITLHGDRNVLSSEQILYGSASGSQVLNRGKHVFPFTYVLPFDIPSTFNGPHGGVTYRLKAIVDRPMRMDYEDFFNFTVISPIDFNRMSKDLQEVTTYSDEKTVCCWCCKGGDITVDVELPKTAFVPGEKINFKIIVTNLSNSNVEDIKVKFKKTVTYSVTSPHSESKEDVEDIVAFTEHGVGAHGEYTYDLQLAIPEYLDVPNFTKCDLFRVSYLLKVSAEMPACTMDMDIDVWDIKMGHVQYTGTGYTNGTGDGIKPGFVITGPPIGGNYPPSNPYPPSAGSEYPPPPGSSYPPPPGSGYSPQPGSGYPPQPGSGYPPQPGSGYPPQPASGYPPQPGSGYPPQPGSGYPPPPSSGYPPQPGSGYSPQPGSGYSPQPGSGYPPSPGGSYPPLTGGVYPPPNTGAGSSYPVPQPGYPTDSFEKPVYPGGQPTAPTSSNATAPIFDNPKAREAASTTPLVPHGTSSEPPPPSYNELQQNANFPYPPQ